jgi:ribosome maturation factor RimP
VGAEERVRELVEPQVTSRDLELYDVELNGGILRIAVDRPGGVPLDEITQLSRVISVLLDEDEDVVPGRYTLEVSSPGLERTLRTPEHFTKSVGSAIRLRTTAAAAAEATDGARPERRLRGTLTAADDEAITVAPEGGGDERRLRYDQIDRAKTVFEWGPTPRPGKGKKEAAKR